MFALKIFKITKVEGNIFFVAEVDRKNKKKVFRRSSYPEVFRKKSVLKYLAKLTGKHKTLGKVVTLKYFSINE